MGADPFKERIELIYRDLERYTYYELLNLTPDAPPDQIRSAFHRMAMMVHPDRFHPGGVAPFGGDAAWGGIGVWNPTTSTWTYLGGFIQGAVELDQAAPVPGSPVSGRLQARVVAW